MSSTANSKFSSLQRAGASQSRQGVVGAINDLFDPLIALSSFTLAALVIAMVITVCRRSFYQSAKHSRRAAGTEARFWI